MRKKTGVNTHLICMHYRFPLNHFSVPLHHRPLIRLLLARSHAFPWHAPQFLEEATARILLRRVGGGYSFPHYLLLDYFANLPPHGP